MSIDEARELYEIVAEKDLPCIVSSSSVSGKGKIIDLNIGGIVPIFSVILDDDNITYHLPCFAVEVEKSENV